MEEEDLVTHKNNSDLEIVLQMQKQRPQSHNNRFNPNKA